MKRFLKQLSLVVLGAAFAMLVVTCGPPGMGMMGDAMVDVGMTLRDGSDTSMPDAMAQSCAMDCTGGGVLRVMTADSDPDQLVTMVVAISTLSGTSSVFEIVPGPMVLTDLGFAREGAPHLEFRISSLPDCPVGPASADVQPLTTLALDDQGATSVNTRYVHEIHGGRYLIPVGSRLCAYTEGLSTWSVRYAGFRPYD